APASPTRTGNVGWSPRPPADDPASASPTRGAQRGARAGSSPTGRRTTRFVGSSTHHHIPNSHDRRRHALTLQGAHLSAHTEMNRPRTGSSHDRPPGRHGRRCHLTVPSLRLFFEGACPPTVLRRCFTLSHLAARAASVRTACRALRGQ